MPQLQVEDLGPLQVEDLGPIQQKKSADKPKTDPPPAPNQDEAVEGYGASKAALEAAGQFGRGAVRGAVSTVQGLAAPIRRAFGMPPATPPPAETTGAGKAGRAVEQAGEFFVPGVGAEKAVSKIPAASRVVKAGAKAATEAAGTYAVAKAQGDEHPLRSAAFSFALAPLSQFGSASSHVPVTRITDQSVSVASNKPQTWFVLGHLDDAKAGQLNDMYKSGRGVVNKGYLKRSLVDPSANMSDEFGNKIIQVPTEHIGSGYSQTPPKGWLRASAERSATKALSAGADLTDKAFEKAVQESAGRVLDLGVSPTWRKMLQKAEVEKGKGGEALQAMLAGPEGEAIVPTKPVIDALDQLADKARNVVPLGKHGQPIGAGPVKQGQQVAAVAFNARLVSQVEKLKTIITEHGPTMTSEQLHAIKQDWSDFVWQGRKFDKPKLKLEARAKDEAVRAMRQVFRADNPTLAQADEAYHRARQTYDVIAEAAGYGRLTPAQQAAKAQTAKRASQIATGAAAAIGGAAYYAEHSPVAAGIGAVMGGATALAIEKAMQSPGWRLLKAATKDALAEAIASGNAARVRELIAPLLSSAAAGSPTK